MNKYMRAFLAGILAWLMSSGNGMLALLQSNEYVMSRISDGEWLSIMIVGFLSGAAGWATLLAAPEIPRAKR